MKFALLILICAMGPAGASQTHKARIWLFVHGAWDGGWDYARVD